MHIYEKHACFWVRYSLMKMVVSIFGIDLKNDAYVQDILCQDIYFV